MSERIKVASPRAEMYALRGMCGKDRELIAPLVKGLTEEHFSSKEGVELFDYIKDYIRTEGKSPSARVLLEDSSLSKSARTWFKDSPKTVKDKKEAQRLVTVLDRYRKQRQLYSISESIVEGLQENTDMQELEDVVAQQLAKARSSKANETFVHFGAKGNSDELVGRILDTNAEERVIPTGLKTFDDESSGLLRGALFTIGGNSGAGKSQLAVSLGENMARLGYKVVIVPLEMSEEEMGSRMLAKIARIDSRKIVMGKLTDKEKEHIRKKHRRWVKAAAKKGGRYTIWKPKGDVSIEEVYEVVDTMGVDVCIIDYMTLLREKPGMDQWKQLGQDARYAKVNADQNNRVNILLVQINDDGTIRYSRAVNEHSANSWVFLANDDTKEQGIMKIDQTKSRNQDGFPFTLGIEYKYSNVYDLDGAQRTRTRSQDEEVPELAFKADV